MGVEIGSMLNVRANMARTLNAMILEYNEMTESDNVANVSAISDSFELNFPCRVTNFLDESYGKYPDGDDD